MSYDDLFEERGGGFGTFVLGALVGAGVALLLAPRSGRETQRELLGAVRGLGEAAGGRVGGARDSVSGLVGRARGGVGGRLDALRDAVDDRVGRVRGAVDEGRVAARQASAELRRRVDEAKASFQAGRRGEVPRTPRVVPAAESAAPAGAVEEVVIVEVTTEPDAGDLAR